MNSPLLDEATFRMVVGATPLVAIDLVVRQPNGSVLLGLRSNRPAKAHWFVPGGRIRKGEKLDEAFIRLTQDELGVAKARSSCRFLGVYEHHYEDSVFGQSTESPSTHYVVLAYETTLSAVLCKSLPLHQHSTFCWFEPSALLSAEDVHPYTKAYVHDLYG